MSEEEYRAVYLIVNYARGRLIHELAGDELTEEQAEELHDMLSEMAGEVGFRTAARRYVQL